MNLFAFNLFCLATTICAIFVTSLDPVSGAERCSGVSCPGPIAFYKGLSCRGVRRNLRDCCPYKYICNRLENRSPNKCYVYGHTYDIGDRLRDRDSNPCDIGCTCVRGPEGADFSCAIVDCFQPAAKPGCYRKMTAANCCPGEEVCPENPEDRAVCEIGGKEYRDGEHFEVAEEPELSCYCGPGYEGKNVEPFCYKHKGGCGELRSGVYLRKKCAPVYGSEQPLATSCNLSWRCQNEKDEIVRGSGPATVDKCMFGNMQLNVGDKLSQSTADSDSVCVDCTCEVPPVVSCKQLPSDVCLRTHNGTNAPIFEN